MHNQSDQKQRQEKLAELKGQESELQKDIERCKQTSNYNQVELCRLKKILSTLKEQIQQLQSSLIPDRPA